MEISQKIKNGPTFWSSNHTSGNISKETQNIDSKKHKHPYVHCNIIYSLQDVEQTQVSTRRWRIEQRWGIYTVEYYSAINKKKNLPFVTVCMDLENIKLSEISQSEKDKYYMFLLICGV